MHIIKSIFTRTKGFAWPAVVCFIAGGAYLAFNDKGAEVLWLNARSSSGADLFFLWVTDLGLGSVLSVIAVFLALYRFRWALLALLGLGWVGILTFITKKVIFTGHVRPMHHFYYADFTRFIHEAPLIYFQSFPSGHTMAIFAFCFLMAYISGRTGFAMLFFLTALLVGLSRIYLLQHFGDDVMAGAFLGILSGTLAIYLVDGWLMRFLKTVHDRGLIHLLARRKG